MNPMNTAPKDGTFIRIYYRIEGGTIMDGVYHWHIDQWESDGGDFVLADGDPNVLGWLPLDAETGNTD